MNVCRKNRKAVVRLVTEALDPSESAKLMQHLERCEACRQYHQEMLSLAQNLERMRTLVESPIAESGVDSASARSIAAPFSSCASVRPGKHTRVTRVSRREPILIGLLLNWRVALTAFCALAVGIAIVAVLRPRPESPALPVASSNPVQPTPGPLELPPTLGAYRSIANQSLDDLDRVLTVQANNIPRPSQSFTAATLVLARIGE